MWMRSNRPLERSSPIAAQFSAQPPLSSRLLACVAFCQWSQIWNSAWVKRRCSPALMSARSWCAQLLPSMPRPAEIASALRVKNRLSANPRFSVRHGTATLPLGPSWMALSKKPA